MKSIYRIIRNLVVSQFGAFKRTFFVKSKKQRVFLKEELKNAKEEAYKAGLSNTEANKNAMAKFTASCDQEKESLLSELLERKANLEVEQSSIKNTLAKSDEEFYTMELCQVQIQLNPQLTDILKKIKGTRRYYKQFVIRLRKVKSKLALSEGPAKKELLDKPIAFYSLSGLTVSAEAFIMVPAFEFFLDLTLLMAIVTSLLLSATTTLFSEFVGNYWKKGGPRLWRAGVLIFGSFVFMSTVRVVHDPTSAIVSVPALALLYSAGVSLAIRRYAWYDHFNLLQEDKSLVKKMNTLEEKILVYMGKATNLHQEAQFIAQENANTFKMEQMQKAIKIEGELQKNENEMTQINEQFDALLSSGLSAIEASFQEGIEDRFAGNDQPITTGSIWKRSVFGIVLAFLFLTGCESFTPTPKIHAIAIGIDTSGSMTTEQLPSPSKATKHLFKYELQMDTETDNYANLQAKVTLFEIGESIHSKSTSIVLENTGTPLLQKRAQVKESVQRFKQTLGMEVDTLFKIESQAGSTNLYRHLGIILRDLVKTNATDKSLYVFSDCISESSILQLSDYQKSPASILTDYDKIAQKLDRAMQLPDLTGISIWVVYADISAAELSYYSRVFMKKYYEDKGAEVSLVSSL